MCSSDLGEPLVIPADVDYEAALRELHARMSELLNRAQNDYPDSPIGQRWAPAALGGTAPSPEMVELERQRRKEI